MDGEEQCATEGSDTSEPPTNMREEDHDDGVRQEEQAGAIEASSTLGGSFRNDGDDATNDAPRHGNETFEEPLLNWDRQPGLDMPRHDANHQLDRRSLARIMNDASRVVLDLGTRPTIQPTSSTTTTTTTTTTQGLIEDMTAATAAATIAEIHTGMVTTTGATINDGPIFAPERGRGEVVHEQELRQHGESLVIQQNSLIGNILSGSLYLQGRRDGRQVDHRGVNEEGNNNNNAAENLPILFHPLPLAAPRDHHEILNQAVSLIRAPITTSSQDDDDDDDDYDAPMEIAREEEETEANGTVEEQHGQ